MSPLSEGTAPDASMKWDDPQQNIYDTLKQRLRFPVDCSIFPSITKTRDTEVAQSGKYDVVVFANREDQDFKETMNEWNINIKAGLVEAEDTQIPAHIKTILLEAGKPVETVMVRLLDEEVINGEIIRLMHARQPYDSGALADEAKMEEERYAQAVLAAFFQKRPQCQRG
jgi:hypothetical protein